jgi:hypothetical protein
MLMPRFTANVLDQGCVLVQAIQAVDTMETSNPFEREVARLFQAALERRLLDIVDTVSTWEVEQILSRDV